MTFTVNSEFWPNIPKSTFWFRSYAKYPTINFTGSLTKWPHSSALAPVKFSDSWIKQHPRSFGWFLIRFVIITFLKRMTISWNRSGVRSLHSELRKNWSHSPFQWLLPSRKKNRPIKPAPIIDAKVFYTGDLKFELRLKQIAGPWILNALDPIGTWLNRFLLCVNHLENCHTPSRGWRCWKRRRRRRACSGGQHCLSTALVQRHAWWNCCSTSLPHEVRLDSNQLTNWLLPRTSLQCSHRPVLTTDGRRRRVRVEIVHLLVTIANMTTYYYWQAVNWECLLINKLVEA